MEKLFLSIILVLGFIFIGYVLPILLFLEYGKDLVLLVILIFWTSGATLTVKKLWEEC